VSDIVSQILREVETYASICIDSKFLPDLDRPIEGAHARWVEAEHAKNRAYETVEDTVRAAFAKTVMDEKKNVAFRRITPDHSERCAESALTNETVPCKVAPMVAVYAQTLVAGVLSIQHTHSLCALHFIRFVLGETP